MNLTAEDLQGMDSVDELDINEHHGVPQSFGGSNHSLNKSILQRLEHVVFHMFAGHLPPDFYIRRAVLNAINWHDDEGNMIPADFYANIFSVLSLDDWKDHYNKFAFRESQPANSKKQAKPIIHTYGAIRAELNYVADAMRAIGFSQYISSENREFSNNAMCFFKKPDPVSAMNEYLIDNNNGERKWTKPLTKRAFKKLESMTRDIEMEPLSVAGRKTIITALLNHEKQLQLYSNNSQDAIINSIDSISTYGQGRMHRLLQEYFSKRDDLTG